MQEQIVPLIMRHLNLMEAIKLSSHKILEFSYNEDINSIVFESSNRDRLINLISNGQSYIKKEIQNVNIKTLSPESRGIIKAWYNDLNSWLNIIKKIDSKIFQNLKELREDTKSEVERIFKAKENTKRYNPNSVK